jgi:hypothetical protein
MQHPPVLGLPFQARLAADEVPLYPPSVLRLAPGDHKPWDRISSPARPRLGKLAHHPPCRKAPLRLTGCRFPAQQPVARATCARDSAVLVSRSYGHLMSRLYNYHRFHKGIGDVTRSDIYFGGQEEILKRGKEQKQATLDCRF